MRGELGNERTRFMSVGCSRNHLAVGTPNPHFDRCQTQVGNNSLNRWYSTLLVFPLARLDCRGSRLAATTRRWSRNGTRHSIDARIVILSLRLSKETR